MALLDTRRGAPDVEIDDSILQRRSHTTATARRPLQVLLPAQDEVTVWHQELAILQNLHAWFDYLVLKTEDGPTRHVALCKEFEGG